ncbi:MAG TPA: CbiX/SirB N-terminal domain-containing protein [Trebonia sp.]
MRHSRITPALVAVAHGSRDPRAAATIGELLSVVRSRAAGRGAGGLDVRPAFLGHSAPSLPQVLGAVAAEHDACVVVPLLLTAAYHSKTDIPALLADARTALPRLDIRYAGTLGPDPLLLAALGRRLAEAGASRACSVVLAAAGSSDPAANACVAALAARWQADGGWRRVVPAYASAASPSPGEAVRGLVGPGPVAVATYLLAPGYFADQVRDAALAAGALTVSGALGAAPEVADVIIDRYLAEVCAERPVPLMASSQ